MTPERVLVVTSTYPQYEDDPRGAFLRRHWELYARRTGAQVRVLAPRTQWVAGRLTSPLVVTRFGYAPRRFSSLTGRFGMIENMRENPLRALLVPLYWRALNLALRREIERFRPSRVAAHMLLPSGWAVAQRCAQASLPYEIYGHGTDVDLALALPGPWRQRLVSQLQGATRVKLASQEKLARVSRWLGPSRAAVRLVVESMAHAVVLPRAADRQARGAGPGAAGSHILFVGRLIRQKGVDILLRAAALLDPLPRLDIAGDGPERARLERLARRLGLDARFYGYVHAAGKHSLYRSASVLCAPSREVGLFSEGAPLVILEARSHGVPVVASRVGGIPELCAGLDDAILVSPDHPEQLADALRTSLARRGDAAVQRPCPC
ncbi:MAG: glycosyltransferase [Nannocystaceae bacterium]